MNERAIQNALFDNLRQKGYLLCCPNYTPAKWFECDLFAVTKAERFVEFEIKVSVSDFKADARKGPSERDKQYFGSFSPDSKTFQNFDPRGKHERLGASDERGPSRFFYVVPAGLLAVEDMPIWAGLIYAEIPESRHFVTNGLIRLRTVKEAPHLHRAKACPRVVQHMASVMYWRYWNLRQGLKEEALP